MPNTTRRVATKRGSTEPAAGSMVHCKGRPRRFGTIAGIRRRPRRPPFPDRPHEIHGPARLHRPTRSARRTEAHRRRGRSPSRDHRDLRPGAAKAGGPALLFERPKGHSMPVLANLFGTPRRVAMGMGEDDVAALREIGRLLAFLQGARAAQGPEGRLAEHAAGVHAGAQHGAEGTLVGRVPGRGVGGRRRRPRAPAGADLLARRRGPARSPGASR